MLDCPAEEDIEIVSYLARKYGCRFEEVSLQTEYWDKVVSYTIDTVKRGLTPNPDMMCNRYIKFGCFEEKWGKDFDKTATGHYATTTELDGKVWLSTAKDPVKDQTDFLAQITNLQVQKLMFPIGGMIAIYFKQGTNSDMAAVNVQNRVSKVTGQLPAEVTKIGVTTEKRQTSQLKILSLYSRDNSYDKNFLNNYFKINIIPRIQRINGVGEVNIVGGDYAMKWN